MPPKYAVVVAIFSTFVATAQTEVQLQINESGSIIALSIIFKVLQAMLVIVIFIFNADFNDYFIVLFFFFSINIGLNYFKESSYRLVGVSFLKYEMSSQPLDVTAIDNEEIEIYFDRLWADLR
jgi:hypothetical protein